MKAVKIVVAFAITALLSGCVVYPVGGYGYYRGGGYYGHHRHHHPGGGYYRR
jgi:hypothetical protein